MAAQEPWPLPRLEQPIRLDGIPDEPAWSAIEPLPMVSFQPVFGVPPSEPTDIRVAYDSEYLYVGAVMLDAQGVRYHSLTRDLWVVWNQQLNTDRDRLEPPLPLSGDRSLSRLP